MEVFFIMAGIGIIVLELFTGFALMGWSGDNAVVSRETAPGPYWFTMALHIAVGIVLPLVVLFLSLRG